MEPTGECYRGTYRHGRGIKNFEKDNEVINHLIRTSSSVSVSSNGCTSVILMQIWFYFATLSGLQIRVFIGNLISLFLIQNICCGYS